MTGPGPTGESVLDRVEVSMVVRRLGAEISSDHPDGVVVVGLLKGSICFVADLVRNIAVRCVIDFLALEPYGSGGQRVKLAKDLDVDVTGQDVLLAVDIVDRGLTVAYIHRLLTERGARSVDVCTLLDRKNQRLLPVELRYVGREIGPEYVVGYGLDSAEQYRNLPDLRLLEASR
jgi:hypoxanthine phosphoribosyltransferase